MNIIFKTNKKKSEKHNKLSGIIGVHDINKTFSAHTLLMRFMKAHNAFI